METPLLQHFYNLEILSGFGYQSLLANFSGSNNAGFGTQTLQIYDYSTLFSTRPMERPISPIGVDEVRDARRQASLSSINRRKKEGRNWNHAIL